MKILSFPELQILQLYMLVRIMLICQSGFSEKPTLKCAREIDYLKDKGEGNMERVCRPKYRFDTFVRREEGIEDCVGRTWDHIMVLRKSWPV